jgi:hypothetical protein
VRVVIEAGHRTIARRLSRLLAGRGAEVDTTALAGLDSASGRGDVA